MNFNQKMLQDNDKASDLGESTYISTESSGAEDTFFRCSLPQEPCFFFIDKKEWQDLSKVFQGLQWTSVIARGIRSIHPYCSFGFKRHSMKTLQSLKTTPLFKCNGYCRFENCPINVSVEVKDEVTQMAALIFTGGDVCHSTTEEASACRFTNIHWRNSGNQTTQKYLFGFHAKTPRDGDAVWVQRSSANKRGSENHCMELARHCISSTRLGSARFSLCCP